MLSKKDLQLRLKEKKSNISTAEVHELMDGFNTPIMDICYACEVSKPTMDIYLGENTTALPKKHKKTIIKFYLDLYENGEEPEIKEPEDPDVVDYADIPEEEQKNPDQHFEIVEEEEDEEEKEDEKAPESFEIEWEEQDDITPEARQRLKEKFKHLTFEKIVFRPKNGDLGEALLEALKYSRQAGIPVHVRNGDKLIKLCEQ